MSKKKDLPKFKPSLKKPTEILFSGSGIFFIITVAAVPVYFIIYSISANGKPGLPFDDAFIHLTFAKNLNEYFSFSYFRNQVVTAGSSSPMYTFILAIGYCFTGNEFVLSYACGIIFYLILLYCFSKLCIVEFNNNIYLLIISLTIAALDKCIVFFSVSGMETILFLSALVFTTYSYKTSKVVPLAVSAALIFWIRLEGIIFIAALFTDYILLNLFFKKEGHRLNETKFKNSQIGFILCTLSFSAVMYFSMNLCLSEKIFPNTFYAKKAFYSPEFMSREYYLNSEVLKYFTDGSYFILIFGFGISVLKLLYDLCKRNPPDNFLYTIFITGFIFIYWFEMPYSGLNGRYLVPLIPFFIIVSVSGYKFLFIFLGRHIENKQLINCITYIVLLIFFYSNGTDLKRSLKLFSEDCSHLEKTRIQTAYWLLKNTDPDDVIATHEIGAIGYYSKRKIIDIAGIVSPELIEKIPDKNYTDSMKDYLDKKNVKYFVTLDNWCKVVNANAVYTCRINDSNPEVFDTYRYSKDTFHILNKEVNKLLLVAEYNLIKNNPAEALINLNRAVSMDSASSLSYFLTAEAYLKFNDINNYRYYLHKATDIFPNFSPANLRLVNLVEYEKNISEFKK